VRYQKSVAASACGITSYDAETAACQYHTGQRPSNVWSSFQRANAHTSTPTNVPHRPTDFQVKNWPPRLHESGDGLLADEYREDAGQAPPCLTSFYRSTASPSRRPASRTPEPAGPLLVSLVGLAALDPPYHLPKANPDCRTSTRGIDWQSTVPRAQSRWISRQFIQQRGSPPNGGNPSGTR